MFTGIIEELGVVEAIDLRGDSIGFTIRGSIVTGDAAVGDSIAVNGVCLTVTSLQGESFTTHVMKESLDRSALAEVTVGSQVNMERAALVHSRLGGHIVQGHVDGVARATNIAAHEQWTLIEFRLLDPSLARYIVEKGSITVNGVSLTVVKVTDSHFSVSLIPTTLATTNLGTLHSETTVNIEVDVIAKYVEKLGGFAP